MKFIADRTLGKLAKELRMLGFDTIYFRSDDTHQLFHLAREEGRTILTRNTKLLPKRPEDRVITVTEDKSSLQIKELIQKEHISVENDSLFSRCLLCNVILDDITREEVEGKVPDFIFHQQKDFYRCPQCGRIYWPGTHHKNMERKLRDLGMEDRR
jgi:uncharacterized protein with PIN domain